MTCPMVLNRFEADVKLGDKDSFTLPKVDVGDEKCFVLVGNKNTIDNKNVVILEEYSFGIQKTETKEFIKIPNLGIEKERIVIISDDNFKHFVQNSTRSSPVSKSAKTEHYYEEHLPTETIMYALAIGDTDKFINDAPTTLQIGGNSTLGKGIVELTIGVKRSGE